MSLSITIPDWVLWGAGIAFALTFGLLIVASFVAITFTAVTGGWLGGSEPWKEFGATFKTFVFFGLPVGLTTSFLWFHVNPWVGIITGVLVFAVLWLIWMLIVNWHTPERLPKWLRKVHSFISRRSARNSW